jgi:hypothetical protein
VKRISVRVSDAHAETLQQRAASTGQPMARLAYSLLSTALEENPGTHTRPTTEQASHPAPRAENETHPSTAWLVPAEDAEGRKALWGAVVALHRRYPQALGRLDEDWWQHAERVEILAALTVWRRNRWGCESPREELAFHRALAELTTTLEQAPGGKRRFNADDILPAC